MKKETFFGSVKDFFHSEKKRDPENLAIENAFDRLVDQLLPLGMAVMMRDDEGQVYKVIPPSARQQIEFKFNEINPTINSLVFYAMHRTYAGAFETTGHDYTQYYEFMSEKPKDLSSKVIKSLDTLSEHFASDLGVIVAANYLSSGMKERDMMYLKNINSQCELPYRDKTLLTDSNSLPAIF